MDYEALQNAWRSSANDPNPAARAQMLRGVENTLARRRFRLHRLLAFAGVVLTVPLVLIGYELITGRADDIDLAREWGLAPFALIPFAALLVIALRHAGIGQRPRAPEALLDAFRALRADNARARARILIIAVAMAAFAPLLGVLLPQMVETGKMAPHEMNSALLVLGGGLAAGAAWMAIKFAVQLVPERRRLDELIRQYEAG